MSESERALLIAIAETVRRMAVNPVAMVPTHDLTAALLRVQQETAIGPLVPWPPLMSESEAERLEALRDAQAAASRPHTRSHA